ncbi:MAG: hypothetical protein ACRCW2_09795 [Cellulosilyticaceae bacterium]
MAGRIRGGMSYVEVLGALLIISLIGTVVMGAVQLSTQFRQMGQRAKLVTRGAEVMMTAVQVALENADWETLEAMTSLEALLGEYEQTWMVDEKLDYTLRLWPVTVQAGTSWAFDQTADPDLTLHLGDSQWREGGNLKMTLTNAASYAFDMRQLSGQFVTNTPWPSDVMGELATELTQRGSYYQMLITKGSVSGAAKLAVTQTLGSEAITLTIQAQGASAPKAKRVTCVIDGTQLKQDKRSGMTLHVVNESKVKVLLKLVGDPEELRALPLTLDPVNEAIDVIYQSENDGRDYYVAVLSVTDETGRVGKELLRLVGIPKEVVDEK